MHTPVRRHGKLRPLVPVLLIKPLLVWLLLQPANKRRIITLSVDVVTSLFPRESITIINNVAHTENSAGWGPAA